MKPTGFAFTVAVATLTLAACAPTTPTFNEHFGESTRILRAQQVHNPEAPVANREKLPDGIEGRAAREAHERYQQSFATPPQPNVNIFGVGLGGTDSGSSSGR